MEALIVFGLNPWHLMKC